jgi:hypothetical protein
MKKNLSFNLMMVISVLISTITPLLAQPKEQSSFARRISRITPRSSLPSWAKGPGFEAAKKWYRDGYSAKNFSKEENRAFRRFKKKFAIGAIISAVLIALGGARYYHVRTQREAAAQAAAEAKRVTEEQAPAEREAVATTQAALRRAQAGSIYITTLAGQVMHPQSFEITDNTITVTMPASWIERAKNPPSTGDYLFKIIEIKNPDGSYSYTAQATDPNRKTLELQIVHSLNPAYLWLEFPKYKKTVNPYESNTRFPLFE